MTSQFPICGIFFTANFNVIGGVCFYVKTVFSDFLFFIVININIKNILKKHYFYSF